MKMSYNAFRIISKGFKILWRNSDGFEWGALWFLQPLFPLFSVVSNCTIFYKKILIQYSVSGFEHITTSGSWVPLDRGYFWLTRLSIFFSVVRQPFLRLSVSNQIMWYLSTSLWLSLLGQRVLFLFESLYLWHRLKFCRFSIFLTFNFLSLVLLFCSIHFFLTKTSFASLGSVWPDG